jgi:sugar lactone lactonase YvrE
MARRGASNSVLFIFALLLLAAGTLGAVGWRYWDAHRIRPTIAGWAGVKTPLAGGVRGLRDGTAAAARFVDPFGLVQGAKGEVYVSDGGDTNRIRRVGPDGSTSSFVGSVEGFADGPGATARFNTPSGLAMDAAGALYVADTGNNAIRKVTPQGEVTTLAGDGQVGDRDGPGRQARFNGPIGVAVDAQGIVYVADTYNDRIRKITPDGQVTTLAGGKPGFQDGAGTAARFDTPCGLTIGPKGELLVADTMNDAVRSITPDGVVSTLVRTPPEAQDGPVEGPVALAATADGYLYIAELNRGRLLQRSPTGDLVALPAAGPDGGLLHLSSPSGLALARDGALVVSEPAKFRLVRVVPPKPGEQPTAPAGLDGGVFAVSDVAKGASFPWPVAPQDRVHEVVGVLGEVRGNYTGEARDHIHAGLDIRADVGAPVLAVADAKVSSPVPNWSYEGLAEGMRTDLITYIHMRVGRTPHGALIDPAKFALIRDDQGKVERVRVKRGTRFRVGEALGTDNRMAHVHLQLGPREGEINALNLPFVGYADHVAPTIRSIQLFDAAGGRLKAVRDGRLVVDRRAGDLSLVVDAYDQTDGNEARRRLGLYRVGYQVLDATGAPLKGFETPRINIEFQHMPTDDTAPKLAYAPSSGDTVHGNAETRFLYVVTNRVRDGVAETGALRVGGLKPGDYTIRIYAADFAGNVATTGRDLAVTVE